MSDKCSTIYFICWQYRHNGHGPQRAYTCGSSKH